MESFSVLFFNIKIEDCQIESFSTETTTRKLNRNCKKTFQVWQIGTVWTWLRCEEQYVYIKERRKDQRRNSLSLSVNES